MVFAKRLADHPPSGRVHATRTTPVPEGSGRRFILDFGSGRLKDLKTEDPVELVVSAPRGPIQTRTVQKNMVHGCWRPFFAFNPVHADPVDPRALLLLHQQ